MLLLMILTNRDASHDQVTGSEKPGAPFFVMCTFQGRSHLNVALLGSFRGSTLMSVPDKTGLLMQGFTKLGDP